MAIDGGADRRIFADDARAQLLDWTPDGKGIVFLSERSGTRAVWLAPIEDGATAGEPRLLRPGMADGITAVGMASDGRLFFVENTGLNNSYLLRLDGRPASRLTRRFEGKNGFAVYSPDGKKLAWFGLKERFQVGGGTLVVRNLSNGAEKSMPAPANGALQFAPEWLGDSRSLIFRVKESGKEVLVRLDVETGESMTIAGVRPVWNSELSADGKAYHYAKEKEGLIVALDVATGTEKTVLVLAPGTFVRGLTLSPDRRTLALAVQYRPAVPDGAGFAKSAIELCDLASRQCRPLIKSADRGSLVGAYRRPLLFTPDGKALISTTNDGRPNRIRQFPLDGGPSRQLVQSADILFDTSISPDGKSITYTESTIKNDLWVLENFLPAFWKANLDHRSAPRNGVPAKSSIP
jgi:Tol biopolymer transport system component